MMQLLNHYPALPLHCLYCLDSLQCTYAYGCCLPLCGSTCSRRATIRFAHGFVVVSQMLYFEPFLAQASLVGLN